MKWRRSAGLAQLRRVLRQRSNDDAVLLLFCLLALVLVTPFVFVRASAGQWPHAVANAAVVAGAALIGWRVWLRGRSLVDSYAIALLYLGGLIVVIHLGGETLLPWAFPVTATTFFVLTAGIAALLNLAALAAVTPVAVHLGTGTSVAGFYASLVASNLLAFIFATAMQENQRRLRALAERDPLTGTRNRRSLEEALRATLETPTDEEAESSLILIDLDGFKSINDTHGHDAGDRILVEVAEAISADLRARDALFRYGGEEFVILAEETSAADAVRLAERVQARINWTPFALGEHMTVSMGIAAAGPDDTPDSWLRKADAVLYEAKRAGRDCIRVHATTAGAATPAAE